MDGAGVYVDGLLLDKLAKKRENDPLLNSFLKSKKTTSQTLDVGCSNLQHS